MKIKRADAAGSAAAGPFVVAAEPQAFLLGVTSSAPLQVMT